MSDTFKCELCKSVFKKAWSDEEAAADALETFGGFEDFATVCEDCFSKIFVSAERLEKRRPMKPYRIWIWNIFLQKWIMATFGFEEYLIQQPDLVTRRDKACKRVRDCYPSACIAVEKRSV